MIKSLLVARALKRAGITDATVQWWSGVKTTPSGNFTVKIRLGPLSHLGVFEEKREFLAHALRAYEVEMTRETPRRISLTVLRSVVNAFPLYPPQLENSLVSRNPTKIPLGLDTNGFPAELTLFDEAGGQVVLMAGSPGTGKSSALSLIVCGLANTSAHIVWFDPKGSADASKHRDRVQVVPDPIEAANAKIVLTQLLELAKSRARALGEQISLDAVKPVVVIVDEWATLGVSGDKKEREIIQQQLRTLSAIGRASKIAVILSTQRPTSENIDVTTRSLASTRICFAVGDKHGSVAALGYLGAEELNPRKDRGTALVEMGHGPQQIKIYQIPSDRTERLQKTKGLNGNLEEISQWDEVCFREQRSL